MWWVLMGQAVIVVLGEVNLKVLLIVGSFWDLAVLPSPGNVPMSCGPWETLLLPCSGDHILPWGTGVCGDSVEQERNLIQL